MWKLRLFTLFQENFLLTLLLAFTQVSKLTLHVLCANPLDHMPTGQIQSPHIILVLKWCHMSVATQVNPT